MANQSIKNAFERFWQHTVLALAGKSNTDHKHYNHHNEELVPGFTRFTQTETEGIPCDATEVFRIYPGEQYKHDVLLQFWDTSEYPNEPYIEMNLVDAIQDYDPSEILDITFKKAEYTYQDSNGNVVDRIDFTLTVNGIDYIVNGENGYNGLSRASLVVLNDSTGTLFPVYKYEEFNKPINPYKELPIYESNIYRVYPHKCYRVYLKAENNQFVDPILVVKYSDGTYFTTSINGSVPGLLKFTAYNHYLVFEYRGFYNQSDLQGGDIRTLDYAIMGRDFEHIINPSKTISFVGIRNVAKITNCPKLDICQ